MSASRRATCVIATVIVAALGLHGLARAQSPLDQGWAALDARRFRDAVRHLEAATAADPESLEAHYWLGVAYWGEDRPYPISADQAIAALRRAAELDDGTMELGMRTLEHLAIVYVRNEHMPEARRTYQQLLRRETKPELVDGYLTQIDEIDLDMGRLAVTPEHALNAKGEIIANVGLLSMHTNQPFEKGRHTWDPVKHVTYFKQAIEADPTLYQAHNNVGVALMHLGRCREAVPYFQQALQVWKVVQPPSAGEYQDPYVWSLRCFLELGDFESALATHEILQTIPEYSFFGTLYTIQLAIAAGEAQDAVAPLKQALAEDPENVEVLSTLASAYAAIEQFDDAVEVMTSALDAIPAESLFFRHLVESWQQQLSLWQAR